jgi:excisionase family DNA binding protein
VFLPTISEVGDLMPTGTQPTGDRQAAGKQPIRIQPSRTQSIGTPSSLLTVREVAEVMRVSNMTVYRLIRSGELVATRVGRSYRIWEGDVRAYLTRGSGNPKGSGLSRGTG